MCIRAFRVFAMVVIFLGSAFAAAEGGGAKPAEAPPSAKSSEDTYAVVQARVAGLEAKIRSSEAEIEKLIEAKQHSHNPEKTQEIISQMVQLHHEMSKSLKEYDQQRSLLKYRYPEKGGLEKREYERMEVKSLEEMEDAMSLSSSLNKTMLKVRTQYDPPAAPKTSKSKKKSRGHGVGSEPPTPSLTEPLVIKK